MHPRTPRVASGIVAAVAAAAAAASPAHAELFYEFTFNATVTQKWGENPDHPWGGVEIGDPAYFKYVIDVEQPDQLPQSSLTGMYALESAEVSFGGIAVEPGFIGPLIVDLFNPGADQFVKIVYRQTWSDDLNDGGVFELRGFNVLPDDSIPIDFDVLDFSTERSIEYGDGTIAFRAEIDSYSYQIVPAPGAALGLLLGACFRTGRRRRY